jgi:hypothetical protein
VVPGNEVTGAIHTVAAHPTDPNTVYVGAINGGIWRTRNATDVRPHWTPLTDHLPSLSIGALDFDPANADRLLAGIGRFSSLAFFGDVLNGLLLTSDGGDSWTEITHPLLLGENISGVAVRGDLLLAASNGTFGIGGLFRSTDGGSSWTQVSGSNGLPNQDVFDLVGDPTDPFRFYVSVRATGIFRSDDGGGTWVNVSLASPALTGVITLTGNNNTEMSTAGDGRLYVAVLVNGRPAYIGFTDDLGASWMAMDLPQTLESNGEVEGLNPGGQGYIHFSIRADPVLSHIVYMAGDRQDLPFPNFIGARNFSGRLFRGNTTVPSTGTVPSPQWEHLTHLNTVAAIPGGGTLNGSSPHADSREMVLDAAGNLLEVDDGGIYARTNPRDNTGDWFSINGDLQTAEFHDIAYDSVARVIFGGTQDTGTPEQIAPGATTWRSVSTADGGGVEVDARSTPGMSVRYSSGQNLGGFRRRVVNANNVVVSQTFPVLTVIDGGNPLAPQFYTPLKLNAVDPLRLIIGGSNAVYESFTAGSTIVEIGRGIVVNDSLGLEAIAYGGWQGGVANPDVLYVGAGARVFVRTGPPPDSPLIQSQTYFGGTVRDIALDAGDWSTAYVIDNDDVFVTTDAGVSWREITGNLTDLDLRAVVFVQAATSLVLVGGRSGVFQMSVDAPDVWTRLGTGLPEAPVFDLDYNSEDDVLVAGTLGRGAWLLPDVAHHVTLTISLKVSPTSASAGATVTVSWSGIAAATANDWIGLYRSGTEDTAFIDWSYVSCSKQPASARPSGSCPFLLPDALAFGGYEFRLFADNSFDRLAISNPLTLSASTSLIVSPTSIVAGGTITASWNGIPAPAEDDWLGLYRPGTASTEYLDWVYVSCAKMPGTPRAAGSCAIVVPDGLLAGTYELRLLANNGFSVLAISNTFMVVGTSTSLNVTPASVSPGDTIMASWSDIPAPVESDWLGLYGPGTPNTEYLEWVYVSCAKTPGGPRSSGSCAIVVPDALPVGVYELRLLANDTFSVLAVSNAFFVTESQGESRPVTSSAFR